MVKLNLKVAAGQRVDVGQGEYRRRFARADQPFEVDEAEAALLQRTGLFEQHVARTPVVTPAAEDTQVSELRAEAAKELATKRTIRKDVKE